MDSKDIIEAAVSRVHVPTYTVDAISYEDGALRIMTQIEGQPPSIRYFRPGDRLTYTPEVRLNLE